MADDKDALKAIETDVVPVLEKIEANTRTRAYKRRSWSNQAAAGVSTAEPVSSWIPARIDSNRPTILAKRERVAKAELKTAIERKKAARAENGQFKSKSQEALKESKQKVAESAAQKTLLSRVGGMAGRVIGGKKGEIGDAAGAAGAGVYYAAFREITDAIGDLRENDSGIVGFLKKKYIEKGASKAQEAQKKNAEREAQEAERKAAAKASVNGGAGKVIVAGGEDGGGLISGAVGKLFGKTKIGKALGIGTEVAAGAAGGGLLARALGVAKSGLGRAGGMVARTSPWLAGGAAAGATGYGVGTLLNKGMGKLSGLVTGGKYDGDGWLGEATFDLVQKVKELTKAVEDNTEEQATGVNWNADSGVVQSAGNFATDTWNSMKRKVTGEKVDPIKGSNELGGLSARYESGSKGSSAVGFDSKGGTSYGKYQIATRTGTMNEFMDYLKEENPVAYDRLKAAGPADAGVNGKFAQEWKAMSADGTLKDSEHDFIKKSHFDPAFSRIEDKGLRDKISGSKVMQDVLWSTSVQHGAGGASNIMNKVYKPGMSDEELVNAIYAERGTKFGGSNASVQASVQKRFADEKNRAQSMLAQEKSGKNVESLVGQQQASPSQIAQQQPQVAHASINKSQPAQPVSLQKESAQYSGALQDGSSSMNGVEGKLDKLIAINEEMKNSASKKDGEKDVENSPNIPMEYDDATLVLMAHDRA